MCDSVMDGLVYVTYSPGISRVYLPETTCLLDDKFYPFVAHLFASEFLLNNKLLRKKAISKCMFLFLSCIAKAVHELTFFGF